MSDINVPRRPTPVPTAFDTWAVLDFWLRRWPWLAIWTVILAIVGGVAAYSVWKTEYTSTAQLIRYTPSAIDDAYRPKEMATPSLVLMLQSPRFLEEVGAKMKPPVTAGELASRISIILDRNGDVVTIRGVGQDRSATVDLVNQFTEAAVAYSQKLQRDDAVDDLQTVNRQLAVIDEENARILKAPDATPAAVEAGQTAAQIDDPVAAFPSDLPQRLQAAQNQLFDLNAKFQPTFPAVQNQKAIVDELSAQMKAAAAAAPRTRAPLSAVLPASVYNRLTPQETAVGEQLRNNYNTRGLQAARRNAIAPFAENPPGYLHIFEAASPTRATQDNHKLQIVVWTCLAGLLGFFAAAGQVLLSEFTDNRVKTRADVRRVTGLPVLATLGDLNRLTPAGRDQWAFRAWTALQSRLSLSPNHGMICGITSARPGEGRSTWVELLSRAASNCGFRVLTVTAQPTAEMAAEMSRSAKANGHHYNGFKRAKDEKIFKTDSVTSSPIDPSDDGVALTTNVLASPGQIVDRLAAADSPPVVNIPLPGWVWNLDRRKQWQAALEAWRAIENVVIFVELPPAAVPETVLLAENIPNLLWLSDSQSSDATETHIELETLRDARCNLVGAVLNREPVAPIRGRFSRWFGSSAFLLAFGLLIPGAPEARAADAVPNSPTAGPADRPTSFSITTPAQRAAWQQKLTLGPGDVLTFHLFGEPTLTREEVPIAPDGRVSYLEAINVMASGLTIDELRDRMNEELGRYRRAPQAFIEPVAYRSKSYSVLGAVAQKGSYPLNRPITVLEAVALARGFETGVSKGTLTESADFSQAFLSRGGKKLPIDFEKLFLHGDLSQNVALEPNDYLYFPPSGGGEIYVLGEVRQPGSVPFESGASVLSAITGRGGFTDHSWRSHILVVRGSLTNPEAIRVDVAEALAGKSQGFALKPGDIIYVNNRPWSRAVDLLDRAASAFVEAAVVGWTTVHVGPSGATSTPVIIP